MSNASEQYGIEILGIEGNEIRWHIGDRVILTHEPIENQFRVRFYRERDDGTCSLITSPTDESRDWYMKGQTVGRIGNAIAKDESSISSDWIKSRIRQFGMYLDEMAEQHEYDHLLLTVKDLLARTVKVEGRQDGGNAEMAISMIHPDATDEWEGEDYEQGVVADADDYPVRQITLTHDELDGESPKPFTSKYLGVFFDTEKAQLELGDDDWKALKKRWLEMNEITYQDFESTDDRIADNVMNFLHGRVDAYPDRSSMLNGDYNAHYDGDDEVLWVHTQTIQKAVDEVSSKDAEDYMGTITPLLRERGVIMGDKFRTSVAGKPNQTIYPCDYEMFGIDPELSVRDDDDDDSDVEGAVEP
jgi:hypothetical protein